MSGLFEEIASALISKKSLRLKDSHHLDKKALLYFLRFRFSPIFSRILSQIFNVPARFNFIFC